MKTNLKTLISTMLVTVTMQANAQWSLTGNAATTSANFLGTTDAQPLRFRTSNTLRMNLDANGKLGLGNNAPVYKFDVLATAEARGINLSNTFNSTSTTYGTYSVTNNTGTGSAYGSYSQGRGSGGSNVGVYGTASEGATNYALYGVGYSAAGLNAYGIYATATGAGAQNYGAYFSTTGTSTTGNTALYATSSGASPLNYGVYASASGGTTNWAGYFVQNTYTGGAVGIGTTTITDSKFSVQQTGTTLATAKFVNTSKGANISWVHFGTTGDWYLRSSANTGKVILQDQNASATVCIGSAQAASGYKLSVAGKVMCTELKVLLQANWPDYVFAKDYELMPLKKLEEFISTNSHLPGVPSAKEMETEGGIAVGEMQTVLLKKLEEANLYILQLNKRLEELEAKFNK